MKASGSASLAQRPLTGAWYRAIQLQHYRTLLHYSHTAQTPSRFAAAHHRHQFPLLYFAETPQLALYEVQAMVGSPAPGRIAVANPATSWIIITVQVQLTHVADLTSGSQRRLIGTTVQELTGDWIGYRLRNPKSPATFPYTDVPTQRLGAALVATPRLEAFVTWSARDSRHKNLVIFPAKIGKRSNVTFVNPVSKKIDRIRP